MPQWKTIQQILLSTRPLFRRYAWLLVLLWPTWAGVLGATVAAMHLHSWEDFMPDAGWGRLLELLLLFAAASVGMRANDSDLPLPDNTPAMEENTGGARENTAQWRRHVAVKTLFSALALWLPVWLGTVALMAAVLPFPGWLPQALWAAVQWAAPILLGLGAGLSMDGRQPVPPLVSFCGVSIIVFVFAAQYLPQFVKGFPSSRTDERGIHETIILFMLGGSCVGLWWLISAWVRGPGKTEFWEPILLGVALAALPFGVRLLFDKPLPRSPGSPSVSHALEQAWNQNDLLKVSNDPALREIGIAIAPGAPAALGPYEIIIPANDAEPEEKWRYVTSNCAFETTSTSMPVRFRGDCEAIEPFAPREGFRRVAFWIRPILTPAPAQELLFTGNISVYRTIPIAKVPTGAQACLKTDGICFDVRPMIPIPRGLVEQSSAWTWQPIGLREIFASDSSKRMSLFLQSGDGRPLGARTVLCESYGAAGNLFVRAFWSRDEFSLPQGASPRESSINRIYARHIEELEITINLRLSAPLFSPPLDDLGIKQFPK